RDDHPASRARPAGAGRKRQGRPHRPGARVDAGAPQRRAGAAVPRAGQARGRAAEAVTRILVEAEGSPGRMPWWAIDVRPDPSSREWVGAWLVARTGHAVEERDDGTLVTFAEGERAA